MIPTCQEVARVIASDEAGQRSWIRRLGLSVHLLMCDRCRRYKAQIRKLGRTAREIWQTPDAAAIARLRDRILGDDPGTRR